MIQFMVDIRLRNLNNPELSEELKKNNVYNSNLKEENIIKILEENSSNKPEY